MQYGSMVAKQTADLLASGITPLISLTVAICTAILSTALLGSHAADPTPTMSLDPTPYFDLRPGVSLPMSGGSANLRSVLGHGGTIQRKYGYTPLWVDEPARDEPTRPNGASLRGDADAIAAATSTDIGAFGAFVLPTAGQSTSALLFNSSYATVAPAYLALLDEALLAIAAPGLTVSPHIRTLPDTLSVRGSIPWDDFVAPQALMSLAVVAALLLPHFISAREIACGCKHLLLLMGMDIRMLLLGQLTVDAALLLAVPSAASIAGVVSGSFGGAAVPSP